MDKLAESGV
jgi:hypothetical protein